MNRGELLEAVIRVKPAVATSNLLEQNNLISFNKKEISSYNDKSLISIPIKTDIQGAMPANELISLLQRIDSDEIKVQQKNDVVEIKAKTTRAKIKTLDVNFPTVESSKKWDTVPEDFIEGLKLCKFSVGQEGNILNNILIRNNKVISCDNYRVTEFIMKDKMKECLIPLSIVNPLISFLPLSFSISKSWISFRNKEKAIFSIKKIQGKYPDIESILSTKMKGTKIELPEILKDSLDRTKILADEDIVTGNKAINISIKNNTMICHGECALGQIDETIKVDCEKEVSFSIVPDFLNQILDKTQTMIVGESSLKFKTKNFQHIVQVIR